MKHMMRATEGPCAGHDCDNCATCRAGRCCRRDRPGYKLPEMGEWEGIMYGELGKLADDGDKVECHCCGRWYGHLGAHVVAAHDLTADEYRALFGLRQNTGLIGPTLAARRIADTMANGNWKNLMGLEQPTTEQRSARLKGFRQRLENRLDPAIAEARKVGAKKAGETRHRRYMAGELSISVEHLKPHAAKAALRSAEALRRRREEDPEWWDGVKKRLSAAKIAARAAKGLPAGPTTEVVCPICGKSQMMAGWQARHRTTCGGEACKSEYKRRRMTGHKHSKPLGADHPIRSPEARAKQKAAMKARGYPEHLREANKNRVLERYERKCARSVCTNTFLVPNSGPDADRKFCSRECYFLANRGETCFHGHKWTPETTKYVGKKQVCRICQRASKARYNAKHSKRQPTGKGEGEAHDG